MKKNVASQVIGAQLINKADGTPCTTGTTTIYVTGDAGTQAVGSVGSGACTHEGNGFWSYAPAQAETNYDHVAFTFVNSNAVNATVQVYPAFPQTGDAFALIGATGSGLTSLASAANLAIVDDFLDTEIAAIKAKTDGLPSDPADASDIAAAFTSLNTKVDTIDDFLDTEIAAIKAKTDNLPSDPADHSDVIAATSAILSAVGTVDTVVDAILVDTAEIGAAGAGLTALASASNLATVAGYIDTEVGAIKSVTDKVDTALELDGSVYRLTTNALEQAPTGGSAPTVDQIADEVEARTIVALADLPTNAELATALASADDAVLTQVALVKAQTDTIADLPTNAELATALGTADDAVLAQIALVKAQTDTITDIPTNAELATALASADDAVLAQVALVKARTDLIPADPADASDVAALIASIDIDLTSIETAIAALPQDKVGYALTSAYDFAKGNVSMAEAYAAVGAEATPVQALYMILSYLLEKDFVALEIFARKLDGTTPAMTIEVDSATVPTTHHRTA